MMVLGLAVTAGNWVVVGDAVRTCPPCLAWILGSPLALAILGVALTSSTGGPPPIEVAPPSPPAEPPDGMALRLLATLQEEGRLVDFLQEEIAPYTDEQIGAAVRGIHEPCRKALRSCVALEPVLRGGEGETITVQAGFDPTSVRLVGNVTGAPPFQGVLRHAGWKVTAVTIPTRTGGNEKVLAPAEVELA